MAGRGLIAAFIRRHLDALLLGFFALVHLVTTMLWLRVDEIDMMRVPDEFAHYVGLSNLHAALSLDPLEGALNSLRLIYNNNTTLFAQYPRALAGLLLGPSLLVFRAANVVYQVVLLVSVYHIGRRCHGRQAGLLAAALVTLAPAAYGGARSVGVDYPAMCLIALAVAMLLRSDGFRRLPDAVGFGACAGLAILVKGQSVLFLVWPAAYVLGRAVWLGRREGRGDLIRPLGGGGLAVLVGLLVSSVWWAGRVGDMALVMGGHASGAGLEDVAGDVSLFGGVLLYAESLPMVLSAPIALAALLALPAFFRWCRHRWEVLAWVVPPLVVHVLLSARDPRYIFPLVPAAALVLAVGLCSLGPRLRSVSAALVGSLAVAAWIACSCLVPGLAGGPQPLCHTQKDLWRARETAKLSGLVDASLTCGICTYAGPPSGAAPGEGAARMARLTGLLTRESKHGEGLLLYTDGSYNVAQAMATARRELPSMLFLSLDLVPRLLPARPRHGRRVLALWDANKPPPTGDAVRLSRRPLDIELEPGRVLYMHLYRLGPTSRWPHKH